MKQQILERQLEFPFIEEDKKEESIKKFQFGIKDLFGLLTYSAIGISATYLAMEVMEQASALHHPKVHVSLFEIPYGILMGTMYTLAKWRTRK